MPRERVDDSPLQSLETWFFAFRGSRSNKKREPAGPSRRKAAREVSRFSSWRIDLIVEKTYEALATRRQKRWRGNWNEPEKEKKGAPRGPRGPRVRLEGTIVEPRLKENQAREQLRLANGCSDIWLRSSRERSAHCLEDGGLALVWGVALANESKSNDLRRLVLLDSFSSNLGYICPGYHGKC